MQRYRVKPGSSLQLQHWDPNDTSAFEGDKAEANEALSKLNQELAALQEVLYAERRHKVLVVLQAMDTGGKDGTIRHVFAGVNPVGLRVANFKAPSTDELDHDYLWRIHKQAPGRGEIVIFNRSHYEDVLIVRVHNLVPRSVWSKRYAQINDFERMLTEEGTTILKFYLHISKDEQKERLQARLDDPTKHWKFNVVDLKERTLWSKYMRAYEEALEKTSTAWAPWYIVPANRKWHRNWVVAATVVETLRGLKMRYPKPKDDLSRVAID
jgi:PPK2 family polyphosphate:nucleotide phosphotransferase